ncbi:MAG: NINE protein [Oscillospiraceae bacterium]|nr:NINE protein [Oscillospiraceae bacterium]
MKNKTTALILSILLGGLGVDRFYLGYTGMGVLKLLTAGCFGVLYILDIVNIATGKLVPADGTAYEDDTKAAAQPKQTINPYEELEKLANLHKAGALTDEEFDKAKKECLAKMK